MIEDLEVRNMLAERGRPAWCNTENKFRCRRYRKQRLGSNAYEDVSPLGRKKQL